MICFKISGVLINLQKQINDIRDTQQQLVTMMSTIMAAVAPAEAEAAVEDTLVEVETTVSGLVRLNTKLGEDPEFRSRLVCSFITYECLFVYVFPFSEPTLQAFVGRMLAQHSNSWL